MTISKDLQLALLSMDAYNRGYDPGITLATHKNGVGTATVQTDAEESLGSDVVRAAKFYAVAYRLNGETIISYRGTDD